MLFELVILLLFLHSIMLVILLHFLLSSLLTPLEILLLFLHSIELVILLLFLLSPMLVELRILLLFLLTKRELNFKFVMLVFLSIFVQLLYVFANFLQIKILHLRVISVFDFLSLLMIDRRLLKFHHIFSGIFI